MSDLPEVTCTGCGRRVKCIRVSDGTVYKPIAWLYPDETKPLEGLCGACQVPCVVCGSPGTLRADPYDADVNDEIVARVLCDGCYEQRCDDR